MRTFKVKEIAMNNSLFFDTKQDLAQTEEATLLLAVRQIPGVIKVLRFDTRTSPKSYFVRISDDADKSKITAELRKIGSINADSLPQEQHYAHTAS